MTYLNKIRIDIISIGRENTTETDWVKINEWFIPYWQRLAKLFNFKYYNIKFEYYVVYGSDFQTSQNYRV